MTIQVYVACDGDWKEPEIRVSGSAKSLADLGKLLNGVTGPITLKIPTLESEFYPVSMPTLVIELDHLGNDRLTVTIDESKFKLTGTNVAFNKLGDSLVNFFDAGASIGEHFQLDYFKGNEVLNDTNAHFIFICDR